VSPSPGGIDETDAGELFQGEIAVRLDVYRHLEDYIKENPNLAGAYVSGTGTLLVIRRTGLGLRYSAASRYPYQIKTSRRKTQ
jgi:hypothetical protein